jgi:glutamate-ammonia-ligase adenylyltransferase
VVREAGRHTRGGWLYAVDARLRPFGNNGHLAPSLASCVAYWRGHAEPWERLVLTRARLVAGDAEVGRRFLAAAADFAYGPPPSAAEMDHLRHIKRRVETERRRVGDLGHLDLKLEPGGIMDIEYLVQTLQITWGQRDPAVRRANTPAALRALGRAGALSAEEAELLGRAYHWFRRLELRLQLISEQPGGRLALDEAGLAAAARRLGWSEREAAGRPEQLVADIRSRLAAARAVVARHLGLGPERDGGQ